MENLANTNIYVNNFQYFDVYALELNTISSLMPVTIRFRRFLVFTISMVTISRSIIPKSLSNWQVWVVCHITSGNQQLVKQLKPKFESEQSKLYNHFAEPEQPHR